MKQLISHVLAIVAFAGALTVTAPTTEAQVYAREHARSDGTPVKGETRSAPDGNPTNDFSYPRNVNLYAGHTAGGNADSHLRNYGTGIVASDEPLHTWPGLQSR